MKKIMGFTDEIIEETKTVKDIPEVEPVTTKKSLVSLSFEGINKAYTYYNDTFDLQIGDKVFVSGKLYGKIGCVQDVNYCFKIKLSDYERVIAKTDTEIKGDFIFYSDKAISFNTNMTPEKFEKIIIPPQLDKDDRKQIAQNINDDFLYGEGWSVNLENYIESEYITKYEADEALDMCLNGDVVYLSFDGEKGVAYIGDGEYRKVEFTYDGENVNDIYCDCLYPGNKICKHEIAMLITMKMLMECEKIAEKNFTVFDKKYFLYTFLFSENKNRISFM